MPAALSTGTPGLTSRKGGRVRVPTGWCGSGGAAARSDDVGDGRGVEVVVDVGRVQALVELGLGAVRAALDGVLNPADDAVARSERRSAELTGFVAGLAQREVRINDLLSAHS